MSEPQPLIPVYRMHQPIMVSPCILGDPCRICVLHALCQSSPCTGCRQGKAYECERAHPSAPAFMVKMQVAMQFIRDGMANFIHRNSALQLNFSRLTDLRDMSAHVNGNVIWQYIVGPRIVRLTVDMAWAVPIASIVTSSSEPESQDEASATSEPHGEAIADGPDNFISEPVSRSELWT